MLGECSGPKLQLVVGEIDSMGIKTSKWFPVDKGYLLSEGNCSFFYNLNPTVPIEDNRKTGN